MAEIFISYRRTDAGYSDWLVSELREFAVFYDVDTIDYGDHFPDRITEALNNCEIFLVVIGPKWLGDEHSGLVTRILAGFKIFPTASGAGRRDQKHPNRLFDPKDWVRQEIETALVRSEVRTVPVLVGGAEMPSEKDLPEALRPLLQKQAIDLSHEKRHSDLKLLTTSLSSWLRGSAYSASARSPFPSAIPYLCDRSAQEDHLVDVFTEKQTKTPVIVMHGYKLEEHHGFVTRLRHQRILEDLLDVRDDDVGIDVKALRWNVENPKDVDYKKLLFTAIKRDVMQKRKASDEEVRRYLHHIRRPLVVLLELTWSDCKRCGDRLLEDIHSAWRSLFQETRQNAAPRSVEPPVAVLLWINVSYDELTQSLSFEKIPQGLRQKTLRILPELHPLEDRHIRTWILLDDVKRHVQGREGQLLSIVEDNERCVEKGKIHMRHFVEAVQEILT